MYTFSTLLACLAFYSRTTRVALLHLYVHPTNCMSPTQEIGSIDRREPTRVSLKPKNTLAGVPVDWGGVACRICITRGAGESQPPLAPTLLPSFNPVSFLNLHPTKLFINDEKIKCNQFPSYLLLVILISYRGLITFEFLFD